MRKNFQFSSPQTCCHFIYLLIALLFLGLRLHNEQVLRFSIRIHCHHHLDVRVMRLHLTL